MPSVVSCKETFGTREANRTFQQGKVTDVFIRVFRIVLSSGGLGADVVAATATGLPSVGTGHPFASYALCNSIRIRPESNDDKIWTAEVQYSSDVLGDDQQPENPLDAPPKKSWSFAPYSRPLYRDAVNGKPIINTAKEQFDPLPEVDDNRIVLHYSRNVPSLDLALFRQYRRAVNNDDFLGWPAGTVRLTGFSADDDTQNDVYFWRLSLEFQLRGSDSSDDQADDWKIRLLNQGFRQLVGNKYEVIQDKNGIPLNQPALLDRNGLELTPEDATDPIFLDFNGYTPLPFNVFGIN